MEVKSMKGIKFKEPLIPLKELKKWIRETRKEVITSMKLALKNAREFIKDKDMILLARSAEDLIWWASQLTLLEYLESWAEYYERKD